MPYSKCERRFLGVSLYVHNTLGTDVVNSQISKMRGRNVHVRRIVMVMLIYFCCLIAAGAVRSIPKTSMHRRRQQQQQSNVVPIEFPTGSRFGGIRTIKWNTSKNSFLQTRNVIHYDTKQEQSILPVHYSNRQLGKDDQSLSLRIRGGGGSNTEITIEWLLTNDPEIFVCGSIFSFVCLLYGAACAIDPRGTARLLYGHEKMVTPHKVDHNQHNNNNNNNRYHLVSKRRHALMTTTALTSDDSSTIKFLMRSMGSTVFGLGLMAAFSLSLDCNHRSKGTSSSYFPAMAVGFLPRSVLYFWYAFIKAPTLQYINHYQKSTNQSTSLVWVSAFLISLLYILKVQWRPPTTMSLPYGMALVVTPIAFTLLERYHLFSTSSLSSNSYPSTEYISNDTKIGTAHEILLLRQLLLFSSMYAVMVLTLLLPNVTKSSGTTSFPAIGLSALTMFLTQSILSIKDYTDGVDRDKLANKKPSRYKFGWSDVATWMALWMGIVSLKGSHMDIYSLLFNLFRCPCTE